MVEEDTFSTLRQRRKRATVHEQFEILSSGDDEPLVPSTIPASSGASGRIMGQAAIRPLPASSGAVLELQAGTRQGRLVLSQRICQQPTGWHLPQKRCQRPRFVTPIWRESTTMRSGTPRDSDDTVSVGRGSEQDFGSVAGSPVEAVVDTRSVVVLQTRHQQ